MKKLTLMIVAVVFAFGLSAVRAEETAKKEEAAKPVTQEVGKPATTAIPAGKAEEKKDEKKAVEGKKEEKKADKKEEKKEEKK